MSESAADEWYKVAEVDELGEGRVKSATAGQTQVALVRYQGKYAAMDNRCPHQGGPLGEGSIEPGVEGKPPTASAGCAAPGTAGTSTR